ncbi:TetR family transcriptional regulator [Streptomyces sp. NPDC046909]|uniref:TetR family transcriptional regulator n=1 Tax=Streptomyces sp. NPDC046909 TaxID=3155617 RepID=UPI003402DC39
MPYDSDATRARIFDAAVAEFAAVGIGGARVERIAERAKANKSLIYRYFGGKEQLFAAVLMSELEQLAASVSIDPDRVSEYVGELFDYHVAHPNLIRLMTAEGFQYGASDVPGQKSRTAYYRSKTQAVRTAQEQGGVDGSLDARSLVLALVGLVGWYFAAPQISRMVMDQDPYDPDVLAAHRSALTEAARRIVTAG